MGKLFGTDGIRGVVGENLTADLAFRTGQAIAAVLEEETGRRPLVVIGKDTRISSDMLESALMAGPLLRGLRRQAPGHSAHPGCGVPGPAGKGRRGHRDLRQP